MLEAIVEFLGVIFRVLFEFIFEIIFEIVFCVFDFLFGNKSKSKK